MGGLNDSLSDHRENRAGPSDSPGIQGKTARREIERMRALCERHVKGRRTCRDPKEEERERDGGVKTGMTKRERETKRQRSVHTEL